MKREKTGKRIKRKGEEKEAEEEAEEKRNK